MRIESSIVTKLLVDGVQNLGPIAIYLEDFAPGQGKITITIFDECWSYAWGAMAQGYTIKSFFLKADAHYIAKKFAPRLDDTVDDLDKLPDHARKYIIQRRREEEFTKTEARELYDRTDDLEVDDKSQLDQNLMISIFGGDEWWYEIPQKPNHEYEYLIRVIEAVKMALKTWQEVK